MSQNSQWQAKRRAVIERAGGKCEDCRRNKIDHIHHLTYERRGHELLTDLLGLCWRCHNRRHPQHDFSPKPRKHKPRSNRNRPSQRDRFARMRATETQRIEKDAEKLRADKEVWRENWSRFE